jgi:hypothetical protein
MYLYRVIIAGGRDFADYALLSVKCDFYLSAGLAQGKIVEIVCGKSRGADALGERYAVERGFQVKSFPADWSAYGRSAGFRRNIDMAGYADALIAFWNGSSPGTGHMIDIARSKGLQVRIVRY